MNKYVRLALRAERVEVVVENVVENIARCVHRVGCCAGIVK
jgi:hypothetical protein